MRYFCFFLLEIWSFSWKIGVCLLLKKCAWAGREILWRILYFSSPFLKKLNCSSLSVNTKKIRKKLEKVNQKNHEHTERLTLGQFGSFITIFKKMKFSYNFFLVFSSYTNTEKIIFTQIDRCFVSFCAFFISKNSIYLKTEHLHFLACIIR